MVLEDVAHAKLPNLHANPQDVAHAKLPKKLQNHPEDVAHAKPPENLQEDVPVKVQEAPENHPEDAQEDAPEKPNKKVVLKDVAQENLLAKVQENHPVKVHANPEEVQENLAKVHVNHVNQEVLAKVQNHPEDVQEDAPEKPNKKVVLEDVAQENLLAKVHVNHANLEKVQENHAKVQENHANLEVHVNHPEDVQEDAPEKPNKKVVLDVVAHVKAQKVHANQEEVHVNQEKVLAKVHVNLKASRTSRRSSRRRRSRKQKGGACKMETTRRRSNGPYKIVNDNGSGVKSNDGGHCYGYNDGIGKPCASESRNKGQAVCEATSGKAPVPTPRPKPAPATAAAPAAVPDWRAKAELAAAQERIGQGYNPQGREKTQAGGGKRRRSRKGSRKSKASRKSRKSKASRKSRKGSRKSKASRKSQIIPLKNFKKTPFTKSQDGGAKCPPCKDGKPKKKRAAPAHAKLQTEVIKMIAAKEGVNYRDAIKKLKPTVSKAIGKSWDSVKASGSMTWMEALQKTKAMLK